MITHYVRSQDHIAEFKDGATGMVITRAKLIAELGISRVEQIDEDIYIYGSAILDKKKSDYTVDIRARMFGKNMSNNDLATACKLPIEMIKHALDTTTTTPIAILAKICKVLDLSIYTLGVSGVRGR